MSISSYQLQIPALMTSTIRPTKNDDLEERNRILKNSHLWVVIGLSKDFTVRSPKCCFWWWASQDCLKTMVQRRVTVCCCLAIFWVVRGLSEGLKWALSAQLKRMIWRRLPPFCKLAILTVVIELREDFTVRRATRLPNDKHHKFTWKQWFRGVWEHLGNWPSFGSEWG